MRTGIRTARGRGRFARYLEEAAAAPAGPITFSELTSGETNADANSYTTASVTLTAGRLYILSIINTKASADAAPSAVATTGGAATFTVKNSSATSPPRSYSVWYCVPASTVTDTILITVATNTGCNWHLVEAIGTKITGATPGLDAFVTGQAASTVATATTVTATLAGAITAGNARFSFGSVISAENPTVSSGTWTPGTGRNHTLPSTGTRVAWNGTPATTDTSAIWTSSSGADAKRSYIVELALGP